MLLLQIIELGIPTGIQTHKKGKRREAAYVSNCNPASSMSSTNCWSPALKALHGLVPLCLSLSFPSGMLLCKHGDRIPPYLQGNEIPGDTFHWKMQTGWHTPVNLPPEPISSIGFMVRENLLVMLFGHWGCLIKEKCCHYYLWKKILFHLLQLIYSKCMKCLKIRLLTLSERLSALSFCSFNACWRAKISALCSLTASSTTWRDSVMRWSARTLHPKWKAHLLAHLFHRSNFFQGSQAIQTGARELSCLQLPVLILECPPSKRFLVAATTHPGLQCWVRSKLLQ